ncbi:tape measure protein [Oenococcus oeni]
MADSKVTGEMGTKVTLDGTQAIDTLKTLKTAVSEATSSWKAHEAVLKSSGDTLSAAKTKYEGLSSVVEKQRSVLDRLKSEQAKVNTETNEGQQKYSSYQKQIDNATTKLVSLTNQQTKAKNSFELQNSGILKLNDSIKQSVSVTNSYVEKLKAEGNETEAAKAKISGLREQQSKLSTLYSKQKEELDKLKTAEGDNSEAISKQTIRVNETATKMAHATSEAKDLREQLDKNSSNSFLKSTISKLDSMNEKTDKADHLFAKIVGAHLVASGITNAFQSITNHISAAIDAGMDYDKEQQKMQAVWLTLTGSSGSATAMVNTINELSVKTGQATDTVNELEQGFYHLHSSKTESDELTKSMLNMADAVGLDSQQIQAVTQDMVNGLSRGTASNGMLNQISQYFPMFRENLAKYETQVNHGKEVTVADLKGMAMAGKISASDIENVFNQLGSGKYDKAADNMLQTMVGMERTIKARVPALIGDIEKPIMNAQNPIYAGISKWVSDPKVADEFTRIGVSAEKGFNTITTAFAKAFDLKSVPNTMNDFLKRLSTGITDVSNDIAHNAPEIVNFFKSVKSFGSLGFDTMIESLKIVNVLLKPFLGMIADHPKAVAKFVASAYLLSKAFHAVNTGVGFVNTTLKTFDKIAGAFNWAERILGIKTSTAATEVETKAIKDQNIALAENNKLSGGSVSVGESGSVSKVTSTAEKAGSSVESDVGSTASTDAVTAIDSSLSNKSALSSITKATAGIAGKIVGVLGIGVSAWDASSSIGKALASGKKSDQVTAASKGIGTAAGAGIGAAIGSVVPGIGTLAGAGIGSAIGDSLGSSKTAKKMAANFPKTAKSVAKEIAKEINEQSGKYTVKLPKVSAKTAYKEVDSARESELKKKYKDELAGLKEEKETGLMSDAEYKKRVASVKRSLKSINLNESTSGAERAALGSQFAKKQAKIEQSAGNTIKGIRAKYNREINENEGNALAQSELRQEENVKIRKATANEKSKIAKLASKSIYATVQKEDEIYDQENTTISKGAKSQTAILKKLNADKGKLSTAQLNSAIKDAKKESSDLEKEATNRYNTQMKIAEKQEKALEKAATETRKGSVAQAKQKYQETKNAIEQEYQGTSATAVKQRKKLIAEAQKTETDSKKSAWSKYHDDVNYAEQEYSKTQTAASNQENAVKNHAKNQYKEVKKNADDQKTAAYEAAHGQQQKVTEAAREQEQDVTGYADTQRKKTKKSSEDQNSDVKKNADDQKKKTTGAAHDQAQSISDYATKQANNSMDASSKQGSGTTNIFNGLGKFFNGLVKPFGIKAIKLQSDSFKYDKLSTPAVATGGAIKKSTAALVGEAGMEAVYKPYSGKVDFVGTNGAQMVQLHTGDQVLNAKDTAKLFSGNYGKTMPGYASGTTDLTSFINAVTKGSSSIWNNISSTAEDVLSKITNPIKTLTSLATKTFNIDSVPDAGSVAQSLSKGMVDKSVSSIGDFLSKLVKQAGNYGSQGNPSGSGVTRWESVIKAAAAKMHVSVTTAGMAAILHRINQESGGNATVVNNWDSNAAKGTPSKGLLQYIQPTLDYWEPKGVKANILNGYDQLLAMFNDSNWLADISVKGGWGPTGSKKYENGGFANTASIFAEAGPEVAIPLDLAKHSRAVELLNETNKIVNNSAAATSSDSTSSMSTSNLESLMSKLVQLSSSQLSETQKSNQTVDNITANKFSRAIVSRAVKGLA